MPRPSSAFSAMIPKSQPIADVLTFFVTVPFLFPFLRQLVRMDESEAAEV